MDDVEFLRWALPHLHMRWRGFRKVRGQVIKRVKRRMRELELPTLASYRACLEAHAEEWDRLDDMCRITISRFLRDKRVFLDLRDTYIPALARTAGDELRMWSAGCASGEEPWTLAILWHLFLRRSHPFVRLRVVATDADAHVLARAAEARYEPATLRELEPAWIDACFRREDGAWRLRDELRAYVEFRRQDVRDELPDGEFHLVACRNLVLTYYDEPLQRRVLARILTRLHPRGVLVIGKHEHLPPGDWGLTQRDPAIYVADA